MRSTATALRPHFWTKASLGFRQQCTSSAHALATLLSLCPEAVHTSESFRTDPRTMPVARWLGTFAFKKKTDFSLNEKVCRRCERGVTISRAAPSLSIDCYSTVRRSISAPQLPDQHELSETTPCVCIRAFPLHVDVVVTQQRRTAV